jgi:hypothetical protein
LGTEAYPFYFCGWYLTALSDDSESVVIKVSEAISSALYEFHFPVEAFCDGIVF